MTIEAQLTAINTELKRIADALEGLLAEQGVVSEPEKAPAKKKTSKKKPAKKKDDNKQVIGKQDDGDDAAYEFGDVRTALKNLKAEVSQAAVKSLLKKYGASTIGQVDEKHYGVLIAEAEAQLE